MLIKKALNIFEKVSRENHFHTSVCYTNLAILYFNTRNLKAAEEYLQKSLKIRLVNFGENHPDVAQCYWWLGGVYEKEGKYQEALNYLYKAHEIFLKFLSEEHPRAQNLQNYIYMCEQLIKK